MRSQEYWNKRQLARLTDSEILGNKAIVKTIKIYEEALQNINKAINEVYNKYSSKTGVSVNDIAHLIEGSEKAGAIFSIQKNMKAAGVNVGNLFQKDYLAQLSRLEALKRQVYWEVLAIAPKERDITGKTYEDIVKQSYPQARQDIRDQTGVTGSFETLDKSQIKQMLNEKWKGGNYSSRVWNNVNDLAKRLPEIVGPALLTGKSYQKTSADIRDEFGNAQWKATRLIRTEGNYFQNQSELQSYVDEGIEWYEFDAVLDNRTSEVCREHNGKIYKVSEAVVGTNYAPMLPNCRSSSKIMFPDDSRIPKQTVKELKRAWGMPESMKNTDVISAKLNGTRDQQLIGESEWISQVMKQLSPKKQQVALHRLDELIFQIDDKKQKQQVQFVRDGLDIKLPLTTQTPQGYLFTPKVANVDRNGELVDVFGSSGKTFSLNKVENELISSEKAKVYVLENQLKGMAGFHNSRTGVIAMNYIENPDSQARVLYHELGHSIDHNLGNGEQLSYSDKFNSLLLDPTTGDYSAGTKQILIGRIRDELKLKGYNITDKEGLNAISGLPAKATTMAGKSPIPLRATSADRLAEIQKVSEIFAEGYKSWRAGDKLSEEYQEYFDKLFEGKL